MEQLSLTRAQDVQVPAQGGVVEITGCGRTIAADVVAFTVRWSGEPPSSRTVTWAARVTGPDGREAVELGYQRSATEEHQYVADLLTGKRQELAPDLEMDAGELTARFPASVVGVAVEWPTWHAVIAVDGNRLATRAITT